MGVGADDKIRTDAEANNDGEDNEVCRSQLSIGSLNHEDEIQVTAGSVSSDQIGWVRTTSTFQAGRKLVFDNHFQ